jgi:hypothetical protein
MQHLLISSNLGHIGGIFNLDLLVVGVFNLNGLGRRTVRSIGEAHDFGTTEHMDDECFSIGGRCSRSAAD